MPQPSRRRQVFQETMRQQPRPTQQPVAQRPAQPVTGDPNFKLGSTMERLQEQLKRANSEIARRGGVAPNNNARRILLEEAIRKQGQGTPPTQTGGPSTVSPTDGSTPTQTPTPTQNGGGGKVDLANNPMSGAQGVYDAAMGGTINQYNTAANRLRERLDASAQGQLDQANMANAARGFGQSGAQDQAKYQTNAGMQNAYAQGLSELADRFESQRQQGLQTALGATNSASSYSLGQQGLASTERIADKRIASDQQIANANNQLQKDLQASGNQFAGGQNQADRDLRARLQQDQNTFQGSESQKERDLRELLSGNELASQERQAELMRELQKYGIDLGALGVLKPPADTSKKKKSSVFDGLV